ncbi:hypothetical protein FACS1894158_00070 [Betaproteobacteria bacterium]|nr:hypothetical protein FACS1894158_00070 [Betaproteobacteria bacterium]
MFNYLSYLCNLIAKRGNAYTCCAACGELPMPPKNRFCTSLLPEWECDVVLMGSWQREALKTALLSIVLDMPWVRYIFVQADAMDMVSERIRFLPDGMEEMHLHCVELLSEHFIVIRSEWLPSVPLCRVDFFTPNGMPLLFVDTNGQDGQEEHFVQTASARTKTLSAVFEQSREGLELPAATKYTDALTRFAYAEQHGILADARILNGL